MREVNPVEEVEGVEGVEDLILLVYKKRAHAILHEPFLFEFQFRFKPLQQAAGRPSLRLVYQPLVGKFNPFNLLVPSHILAFHKVDKGHVHHAVSTGGRVIAGKVPVTKIAWAGIV